MSKGKKEFYHRSTSDEINQFETFFVETETIAEEQKKLKV